MINYHELREEARKEKLMIKQEQLDSAVIVGLCALGAVIMVCVSLVSR